MARFYADIQGNRGQASRRLGTKNSGMSATVNGWEVGVDIMAMANDDGTDSIRIVPNGGSNTVDCVPVSMGLHRDYLIIHTRKQNVIVHENGDIEVNDNSDLPT
jgi:hypothetical protein